ncbi:hypothetical protein A3D08_03710 [Candidatus Roizmanbacteria bacterium RIFCSPHIGHO2_02_FULL_43_11]|uniref:DUF4012 domain-containing protein n=1 Tax=Candidatus Roizmanbacteria bacterium RIFCSPHIGHO2_02_FULL_43_11 TaxID=1802043 RepID=A0A1F7HGH8_9BACT|nr:MAG: hypothetical protein A3D08_03710 [Candidatus Roizmanbacteria bacterium RIFCSPHIGHO2_02_FULL_43_11]
MQRVVETEQIKETAVLIQDAQMPFTEALIKQIQIYTSVQPFADFPENIDTQAYIFCAKERYTRSELATILEYQNDHILIVTYSEELFDYFKQLLAQHKSSRLRCVRVDRQDMSHETGERVLWFMLSHSSETVLDLSSHIPKALPQKKRLRLRFRLTRKRLFFAGISLIIALHSLFLLPLSLAGLHLYNAGKSLEKLELAAASKSLDQAKMYINTTHATYTLAEPGLQFLFIAQIPNNVINILDNTYAFLRTVIASSENTRVIFSRLLKKDKTSDEIADTRKRLQDLSSQMQLLEKTSLNLRDQLSYNIPFINTLQKRFEETTTYFWTSSLFVRHLGTLLADGTEKNYLVFFYNNMELRPGGGFIGSFAHVKVKNFTLENFDVYDVYDADGQLKDHVRPPRAIRDILEQPHWFLRDSNFSPDFEENIKTAEFFLAKELGMTRFDGAFAMTTTALTYMLDAFGQVYVPDFNDTITADNFYLKAQTQSEMSFFPGSTQKKSFLSMVGKTIILKLEDASPVKLGSGIKRALDEKHMVIFMRDPQLEGTIEKIGWSGKILNPQCINAQDPCILNHIFPVEANLGVNKANFFVSKLMKLQTIIQPDMVVKNNLSISFTNNSSPGVFPGGTYTNYFQVYLPVDASIENVELDGQSISDYEESKNGVFKIVATRLDIPPQQTSIITISYHLAKRVKPGYNTYQIVLQKQIGSFNSDFSFEMQYPSNISVTSKNFQSIAKNQTLLYNSNLSTNKVFLVEFVQQ